MNNKLKITDQKLITEVLNKAEFGTLALSGDKPYAVPVNYVYHEEAIYFHGSLRGKKMEILKENPYVSFNVISDDVVLPSYIMSDEDLACPATAFFKSVTIDGKAVIIESLDEKRIIFTALMEKLQKEGNYTSFTSSEYNSALKKVAVVKIEIEEISAKFKFGQNYSKSKHQLIIKNLKKRDKIGDSEIIKNMETLYKKS